MSIDANIEQVLKQKAELVDRHIEKYVPREFKNDSLAFKISLPRNKLDLKALNETLAKPFWDFMDRGGKRWRPALFILVCDALGGDSGKFLDFAAIPEIIHNGTLIADDVEDSSKMRRGKPCTYELFGLDVAINLSDAMYFLPMLALIENMKNLTSEQAKKVYEIYVQEMINLSFGQAIDIAWHKGLSPANEVSEEQYLQMCSYKTGTLARMAAKMAAVLAAADEDTTEKMGKFAESVGVAFQIQDDVLDLVGEEFAKGKGGLGMDITEGKLTLIVIHALQKATPADKKEMTRILSLHTTDEALRRKAIQILQKYGSIEYAKKRAAALVRESWNEVDKVLVPSEAKKTLKMLADFLINRNI
jgi:geranylgeranyl diphosphate synthase type I